MIPSLQENWSYMQNYRHEATEVDQSPKPWNSFSSPSPFGIMKADRMTMPPPMRLTSSIIPPNDNDHQYNMFAGKHSNLTESNINPSERHSTYSCSFLRELEGAWTTDTPEEDEIRVTVACHGNQWHAIVCAVKSGTGDVPDHVICLKKNTFTLRSMDGNVMAIMYRAMSTKNSLTWFSIFGTKILWHRKWELQVESSPRNSTSTESSGTTQMCSTSSCSSPSAGTIPELCKPICNAEVSYSSRVGSSSSLETQRLISVTSPYSLNKKLREDDLIELFQNHCTKSPSLLWKVLDWGISQIPNQSTDRLELERLACGRLWVSAFFTKHTKKKKKTAWWIIDELKGAYELVSPGVYLQPPALPGEPGAQHRLRKNNYGLWFIEKHNIEKDEWVSCVQELHMGKWINLKNRELWEIKVVSMLSILTRMTGRMSEFGSMQKGMEFLFTSCNQKKLNSNLKARNIKHNIANLHIKLEKQRSLCFAIRVASIADSIALENTAACSKEKF